MHAAHFILADDFGWLDTLNAVLTAERNYRCGREGSIWTVV